MLPYQENNNLSQEGREDNIHRLENEVIQYVHTLLSIHNFNSITKFRESLNSILFRVILHPDQITTELEAAMGDMQHINRFLSKLEEYESNKARKYLQ